MESRRCLIWPTRIASALGLAEGAHAAISAFSSSIEHSNARESHLIAGAHRVLESSVNRVRNSPSTSSRHRAYRQGIWFPLPFGFS